MPDNALRDGQGEAPKQAPLPVTVAIPVKNEEANLAACLDRLHRFAEIVVIDSGSTDGTRDIAASFGARIGEFAWDGGYPKKRNWFLLNAPPTQPWVLFLDADEVVDETFCDALGKSRSRSTATDSRRGRSATSTISSRASCG